MTNDLIERDEALARIRRALDEASAGRGSIVVVTGEAGTGKTSLLRAFVEEGLPGRVLLGACDDLEPPRTLGPIRDFALQEPRLREALSGGLDRDRVMAAVERELSRGPHPTTVVIEDLHWADDATIDVLTFLSRRVEYFPVVLLLSVRDTDLEEDSRLHRFLGSLIAARSTERIALGPLSRDAVHELARDADMSGSDLYRETSGNPFYVTELLAARTEGVPAAVRQVVLGRVGQLPEPARDLLELLSITPGRTDTSVLDRCRPGWTEIIEPAERRGMVRLEGTTLRFRHELARRAVEGALAATRRQTLHRQVLAALLEEGRDWANILHHADRAGDVAAIVEFGPRAARRAANANAVRQAAVHFQRVLVYADRFPAEERAQLYEEASQISFNAEDRDAAVEAADRALALRTELGDPELLGRASRWRGRVAWWVGDTSSAWDYAARAIETLEALDPSVELARAYAFRAQLGVITQKLAETPGWADQAIAVAEHLGERSVVGPALIAKGMSLMVTGTPGAEDLVMQGIELAREHRLHDEVARAYMNMAFTMNAFREYGRTEQFLDAGSAYARDYELVAYLTHMQATRCMLYLDRGRWDEALEIADPFVRRTDLPITVFPALYVAARILSRREDRQASALVDRAWAAAEPTEELQRIGPGACLTAEHAWLNGDSLEPYVPRLQRALALAEAAHIGRVAGEAAMWLQRAGVLDRAPTIIEPGYAAVLAGDWAEAARIWRELGCPYETADALASAGDPDSLREALRILDELGAEARASGVRAALQRLGAAIPRGPQAATRTNPAGLTPRQVDVLRLLGAGRTNAEIAEALVLSTRTVDHHVAAILGKLGAANRREAAQRAATLGLLDS